MKRSTEDMPRPGRRARHFYVIGSYAFIPLRSGVWLRTHYCVAIVACNMCDAKIGEPCHSKAGYEWSGTHFRRRALARHLKPASGEFEYPSHKET